jgi:hypothetical protein
MKTSPRPSNCHWFAGSTMNDQKIIPIKWRNTHIHVHIHIRMSTDRSSSSKAPMNPHAQMSSNYIQPMLEYFPAKNYEEWKLFLVLRPAQITYGYLHTFTCLYLHNIKVLAYTHAERRSQDVEWRSFDSDRDHSRTLTAFRKLRPKSWLSYQPDAEKYSDRARDRDRGGLAPMCLACAISLAWRPHAMDHSNVFILKLLLVAYLFNCYRHSKMRIWAPKKHLIL